jgi:hypothetical protein
MHGITMDLNHLVESFDALTGRSLFAFMSMGNFGYRRRHSIILLPFFCDTITFYEAEPIRIGAQIFVLRTDTM